MNLRLHRDRMNLSLPFVLPKSPSNFRRLVDIHLGNLVGTECRVFIDDEVVFSKSAEEHALRLENVLHSFNEANLQLHCGKCVFAQTKVQYLGFVLPEYGFSAPPTKWKLFRNTQPRQMLQNSRHF